MLCMEVINPWLKSKTSKCMLNERVTYVDDLVNKTVCVNVSRAC